jgi:hypothetical protein
VTRSGLALWRQESQLLTGSPSSDRKIARGRAKRTSLGRSEQSVSTGASSLDAAMEKLAAAAELIKRSHRLAK